MDLFFSRLDNVLCRSILRWGMLNSFLIASRYKSYVKQGGMFTLGVAEKGIELATPC
jgi:hypothetical protein